LYLKPCFFVLQNVHLISSLPNGQAPFLTIVLLNLCIYHIFSFLVLFTSLDAFLTECNLLYYYFFTERYIPNGMFLVVAFFILSLLHFSFLHFFIFHFFIFHFFIFHFFTPSFFIPSFSLYSLFFIFIIINSFR